MNSMKIDAAAGLSSVGPGSSLETSPSTSGSDPISILTTLDAVVYDWDIPSDRLEWGPNADATLAGFPGAALATGAGFAGLITADSETTRFQAIQNGLASDDGQGAPFRVAYRIGSAEGGILDVEDFGRWFADGGGKPCRVHGVVRVLSRAATAWPASNAITDDGVDETLCTRRVFNAWVDARCAETRPADAPFALLIVGITNLAAVNRRDGYDAADELILAVGRRLAKSLRKGDKLVRYSGGKFSLLVALGPSDQLEVAATRIARRANGDPFDTTVGSLRAHVRVGAALAPRHGRNAHLLLQRADEAYEQAEASQSAVALYTPSDSLGETRRRETRVADEIVAALNERRVVLAFQPIVPTKPGRLAFEEALIRLRQDDGALLGPDAVIPVAEKLGLIELLDERVLELTLDCLAENPARRLSMNISIDTLRAPDWIERLRGHLTGRPGCADRLMIEIVETQAIEDIDATARVLRRMKDLGLKIAMDDFGSGHTSFRNLRGLGVDMVKIDGAFVQNLARSVDDRFFVRTLASLASHLDIETVAEWVEDSEAMALLTEWGVDYLQGHVIGRAEVPDCGPAPRLAARVGV